MIGCRRQWQLIKIRYIIRNSDKIRKKNKKIKKFNFIIFEVMSRRRNSRKNCCEGIFSHLLRIRFTPEELEQRDKSRKIDKFLEKDKNSFRRQVNFSTYYFTAVPLYQF